MSKEGVGERIREERIEAVLKLQTILERLPHENEVLRKKPGQLQKPPTNSRTASQPPSLDRKGNRPGYKARKRHDPGEGHEKHGRQFVEHPDVERCEQILMIHVRRDKFEQDVDLATIARITLELLLRITI